jgi:hypothetical protein
MLYISAVCLESRGSITLPSSRSTMSDSPRYAAHTGGQHTSPSAKQPSPSEENDQSAQAAPDTQTDYFGSLVEFVENFKTADAYKHMDDALS